MSLPTQKHAHCSLPGYTKNLQLLPGYNSSGSLLGSLSHKRADLDKD